MWRTPGTCETTGGAESPDNAKGRGQQVKLRDQVKMWPTPTANEDACGKPTGQMQAMLGNHPALGKTKESGSLNPAWVEWLMGYPTGHTVCADWATPSSRKSRLKSSAPSEPSKNPNPSNQPQ